MQLKPTTIPKWTRENNTSQKSSSLPSLQDEDISCPLGTVIIKRTTLEDLIQFQHLKSLGFNHHTPRDKNEDMPGRHYATAHYSESNYGAMGNINIWDPHVKPDQFSRASIYIEGGSRDTLEIISAGWIVSPKLNQNHSGLFTTWSAASGNGCYNTICPGFVQVSSKFALGTLARPVSIYDGQQYHLEVLIFQDHIGHTTQDWWFVVKGEPIGYWPKSLFNYNGLGNAAYYVYWGGEVFSEVRQRISPMMGSGRFPQDGFKKAAYVNGLRVIDGERKVKIPPTKDLRLFANTPNCYKVETISGVGEYWSSAIFYGGPGGCTRQE